MPHHFTKSTVEASIWCNVCRKETPWKIADGRRQYCLVCYAKGIKPEELCVHCHQPARMHSPEPHLGMCMTPSGSTYFATKKPPAKQDTLF